MKNYLQFKNMAEMLEFCKNEFGEKNAFELKDKNVTYADLYSDVRKTVKYFENKNYIGKKIAVLGKNAYEWVIVYLATIVSGGIIVPIDRMLSDEEISTQLKSINCDVLFCIEQERHFDIVTETNVADSIRDLPQSAFKSDKKPEEYSVYLFTSGTTGVPKIVPLTEKNIMSNLYGLSYHEDFEVEDRNLVILPLNHTFSITGVLLFLSIGMTLGFCDGLKVKKSMLEFKPTILVGVPLIAESVKKNILKEIKKQNKEKSFEFALKITKIFPFLRKTLFKSVVDGLGGKLRFIIVGGAAFSAETEKWFNDLGIFTVQGYGLTECSPVLSAENAKNRRYGSIGKPMHNVEMKIADDGEIVAKGDNIIDGYLNNEEENKVGFENGWFHTGDMGYMDKDGFIFITGRKKNMIVGANGKNIYPEEIEEKINNFEYVKECIVYLDNVLTAKVVYEPDYFENLSEDEIFSKVNEDIKELNTSLAEYKKIVKVKITDEALEKTASMKIKRSKSNM